MKNCLCLFFHPYRKSMTKSMLRWDIRFAATPLPDFMNMLSELQKNAVRQEGKSLFYHASVRALVSHRYLKEDCRRGECAGYHREYHTGKIGYIFPSDDPLFKESESEIIRKIFLFQENTKDVIEWQIGNIKRVGLCCGASRQRFHIRILQGSDKAQGVGSAIGKEFLFQTFETDNILDDNPSFKGEPLEGLQVMGPSRGAFPGFRQYNNPLCQRRPFSGSGNRPRR